jgi:hypothetical protein
MAIAGHISPRMLEHYSHIRMDAKRKALDALSGKGLPGGYDTKDDTKPQTDALPSSYVIEKNGGDDGTRTRGLCRDGHNKYLQQLTRLLGTAKYLQVRVSRLNLGLEIGLSGRRRLFDYL